MVTKLETVINHDLSLTEANNGTDYVVDGKITKGEDYDYGIVSYVDLPVPHTI